MKSAIVESIRYVKEIIFTGTAEARKELLIEKMTGKLNQAGLHWDRRPSLSVARVRSIITTWAATA